MNFTETHIPKTLYRYIIVLFLITFFLRMVLAGYYNSNYGGIEQNVIYGIQRIILGQPLYQDPSGGTYAVMQYTPLYYYFIAGIAKAGNIYANNVQAIYELCRLLALLFNLFTLFIIALIIRMWGYRRSTSIVFAMPLLPALTAHYFTRGDSMHLFLFAAALYAYLLYNRSGQIRHILIAALFTAGCIMVKQSGVLVAGIIGFCLLFSDRKYLVTVLYSGCTAGFAYLIAAACVHGDWHSFYQNACLGLKNGTDLSFLVLIFTSQFFLDMVPCYILGGVMVWLALRKKNEPVFRVLATGAALSFLFAAVTGLKIGSSNNYFTEFLLFVITAMPYLLQSEQSERILITISGWPLTVQRFTFIALLILTSSKTIGFFTAVYIDKSIKNYRDEYLREEGFYSGMKKKGFECRNGEYIFFTDRQFFDNIFIGHSIIPNKDVVMQVYAAGKTTYDYSAFINGMNSGMIKYIVTDESKQNINEWEHSIPFIHFDTSRFKWITTENGISLYAYSGPER